MPSTGTGSTSRRQPAASVAAARGARRREATRQRALDAAEQCLTEEPGAFRIEDVAARAGVSAASIYTHFGTKDLLVAAVVQRLLQLAEERLLEAFEAPGSPVERFELVGRTFMELLMVHPAISRYVLASGEQEPEPGAEAEAAALMGRLRAGFEHAIQAAVDAGQIVAVDARQLSFSLLATWTGVASFGLRRDALRLERDDVEAALLQTIRTLTSGLQPDECRPRP